MGKYIMKKLLYLVVSVLLVALVLTVSSNTVMAEEDKSNMVNVLLENEKVRIVEAIRHPGTIVPMHTHPSYAAYIFEACKVKFTFPDGKTAVKDIPAGKLVWSDGVTHEVEVLGNTDLHVLHIDVK
jgi:hypothetical protein